MTALSVDGEGPAATVAGTSAALAALARIEADLQVLADADMRSLPGDVAMKLAARASVASARLLGVRLSALTQVEATGVWAMDGSRAMAWALARNEDASVSSIKSELTLAQRLDDHLPLTAAALRAGELSADKARILARLAPTSKARCAALADPETGERFLLAKAAMLDVWGLAKAVRYWAYRVDPEADDKNYRDDAHRWELSLADTMDGTAVRGFLSPEGGQLLGTALAAIVGTPDKADLRTRGQRNADALGTLARFFLDSGTVKTKAGVRPHLNVTVSFDTLVAASSAVGVDPAVFTETGLPIPRVVLDRLACDGEVSRVIFGPDSIVLDAGRTRRIVSDDQRRAVIARDRECSRPGCHAPPRFCEVHHRIWWDRGGGTSVVDSVLLCFHCHDWVHREGITITRVDDTWLFTRDAGPGCP